MYHSLVSTRKVQSFQKKRLHLCLLVPSVMKFVAVTLLVCLLSSSLLHDSAEARPAADLSPEMGEVVGAGQEAAVGLGNAAAEGKEARCTPPGCR